VGGVLQAQGQFDAAQAAFSEALAISRRLAEQDPSNTGWQRELAVAHNRIGGVLQAQGQFDAAQAAFSEALAISRRLAEQDPSNTGWQCDLALAHSQLAGVLEAKGELAAARPHAEGELAIYRRHIGERDPQTSVSALKLVTLLLKEGRGEAAASVLGQCLAWILTTDAEALPPGQREIKAALEDLFAKARSN
jgi:tetratricopeptide (TPR) repeat protein